MDCQDYITVSPERKRGQHLGPEERGAIKALKKQGCRIRGIAREINCAPNTVRNELERGAPPRKSNKGPAPGHCPKQGEAVYKAHRANSHKPLKAGSCKQFIDWVAKQVREHRWSLDACCGFAKRKHLFTKDEMVCTHTLYNMAWAGLLPIQVTELPEDLKCKPGKTKDRENRKRYGTSITERPKVASLRTKEGHWEGDTVVGKRDGQEAVILSLLEKKTENYLAIRIPGKTGEAVMEAMLALQIEYGEHFSKVFKTITAEWTTTEEAGLLYPGGTL